MYWKTLQLVPSRHLLEFPWQEQESEWERKRGKEKKTVEGEKKQCVSSLGIPVARGDLNPCWAEQAVSAQHFSIPLLHGAICQPSSPPAPSSLDLPNALFPMPFRHIVHTYCTSIVRETCPNLATLLVWDWCCWHGKLVFIRRHYKETYWTGMHWSKLLTILIRLNLSR